MIVFPLQRTLGRLAVAALGLLPALAVAHGLHGSPIPSSAAPEQLYGTVHEIVINDRVAGMTVRQLTLQPAQGPAVALHGTPVDSLKAGSTVAVTGQRNGSQFLADSLQTLSTPANVVAKASRTVEGQLAMLHADNLDGTSSWVYEVHGDDGSVTPLELAVRPDAIGPGMRIAATGSVSAATGALVPDRIDILALGNHDVSGQSTTVNKVLVILLKFSNTGADPFPTSTAQSVMTTATNSVANYYNEVSYGQQQLAVTITPWLTSTTMAAPSTCDWSQAGSAADAAATAAGYTATYDFRVYVFPRISACGWSGLGYVGFPHLAYINGSTAMQTLVVAHEMGHNFGLLHAASLDCGTQSIGGTCTSSEYGDPFDVMGNQRAMHFNAAQKSLLGWFSASAVKTHSTGSATYTLSPIESAGGSTYAVKIPALAKRTYWLEYRQPIGQDAGLSAFPTNGVQVRVAAPFEQLCSGCVDDTEFLDMTPATSAFTDGALTVGNTFRDETGLSINVLSATPTSVTVNVGWGVSGEVPAPDVDGSGTTDLLWRNTATGLSTAWMMSGGSMSWSSALLSSTSWNVVADGDFNGDGKSDLVWHNSATGDTALWLMGNGVMSSGATLLSDPNWTVAFTGDFDGDGKTDLLWHNSATGETAIWLMNGTTMKSGAIIMSDPNWSVTVVGDFDGDGKTDLVWRNSVTGATAIWLMNGAAMKSGAIVVVDPNWKATHAGDLDGDGKADLVWYNSVTGDTNVWIMNGLTRTAGATIRTDVNTHVTHIGDLNNDGKADLIWRNDVSGATIATLMNGITTVSSATLLTDPLTQVTVLGDFNGDGKADLIWRNTSTGVTTLWLMNGLTMTSSSVLVTDPNWVVVNPQ
jgi:M6 family metalloprotease-like protein